MNRLHPVEPAIAPASANPSVPAARVEAGVCVPSASNDSSIHFDPASSVGADTDAGADGLASVGVEPESAEWAQAASRSNADTATKLGLAHGQLVKLRNQDGAVSNAVKVTATQRIRPATVYMVYGFGHTRPELRLAYGRGANAAQLLTALKVEGAEALCAPAAEAAGVAPGSYLRLWPHRHHTDGFFAAVWQRRGG